ncbi:hypothetical protein CAMSH0001_1872 [Campylobacter showae RM3277]|uniref:Uncharacterized protein n=1 Tax=Campylobacter showae RM3277 TaxID=553219 RepID=C6RDF6_9BACT|nr:hypothetical protein CAMSH0001_1872 [Campylobacter showae RM3277]
MSCRKAACLASAFERFEIFTLRQTICLNLEIKISAQLSNSSRDISPYFFTFKFEVKFS